ncbi:MAG: hypothetical protein WC838_07500, partial [Candidatus Margulisiibacteriota bacterium]
MNQGIYSVVLDQVSANVFSGDDRYLEVQVGSEVLAPRTKINSVGYALQAGELSADGYTRVRLHPSSVIIQPVLSEAKLNIGTSYLSTASVVVAGAQGSSGIYLNSNATKYAVTYTNGDNYNIGFSIPLSHLNEPALTITSNGNVGIGTTAPQGKLETWTNSDDNLKATRFAAGTNGAVLQLRHSYSNTLGVNVLVPGTG